MEITKMIIYPLPPQELDDDTLSEQIEAIAQTLCNVHHNVLSKAYANEMHKVKHKIARKQKYEDLQNKVPLIPTIGFEKYTNWASECRANYLKLVDMGVSCCAEYNMRFNDYNEWMKWKCEDSDTPRCKKHHEYESVIFWGRDNIPDLPLCDSCKAGCSIYFPLNLPEEYIEESLISSDPNDSHYDVYGSTPEDIIDSYRNYYCAKLPKDAKWTRREKPSWL